MAGRAVDYDQIDGALLTEQGAARLDTAFQQIFLDAFSQSVDLTGNGIASGVAFGSAVVHAQDTIDESGHGFLDEVFGTPTVTPGAVTIAPSGWLDEALGSDRIAQDIDGLTGIVSGEAFGALEILTGVIAPSGFLDELFGTPTVRNLSTIAPAGIPTEEAVSPLGGARVFTWEPVVPDCVPASVGPTGTQVTVQAAGLYDVIGVLWGYNPGLGFAGIPGAFSVSYLPHDGYVYPNNGSYGFLSYLTFTVPIFDPLNMYYYPYAYGYVIPYVILTNSGYSAVQYWQYPTGTTPPTITQILPREAGAGDVVTIEGARLDAVVSVHVGTVAGGFVSVPFSAYNSGANIRFTAPAHATGVVQVYVQDSAGRQSTQNACTELSYGSRVIDLQAPPAIPLPPPVIPTPTTQSGPGFIYSPAPNSNISGTVTFTWVPLPNTMFYYVNIGRASGGGDFSIANVYTYDNSVTIPNIPGDGPIYVKVRASQSVPNAITPGAITPYNNVPIPVSGGTVSGGSGFGIPSHEAFGAPTVVRTAGHVISPSSIPSGEHFGVLGVSPIQIFPSGIASQEKFGSNIGVNKQPIRLDSGIPTGEAVGKPVVSRPLASIDEIVPNAFAANTSIHLEIVGDHMTPAVSVMFIDTVTGDVHTIFPADFWVNIDIALGINIASGLPAGKYHTIIVTANGQTVPTSNDLLYIQGVPTVTGVTPGTGASGQHTTITGTNFGGASNVYFATTPGETTHDSTFIVIDDTHITAVAPVATGTVDIQVKTAVGKSAVNGSDHYTYGNVPTGIPTGEHFGTPVVTTGPPALHTFGWLDELFGTPTVRVEVRPSGFLDELFGTPTVFIRGIRPTGIATGAAFGTAVVTRGAVDIDPGGIPSGAAFGTVVVGQPQAIALAGDGIVSGEAFGSATVSQPIPTISSVTQIIQTVVPIAVDSAGGLFTSTNTVVIHGTGFSGATDVLVAGASGVVDSITVVSDTVLTVHLPAHAVGVVHLQVVTPNGTSTTSAADEVNYTVFPTITSYTEYSGPAEGGISFLIYGTGFSAAHTLLLARGVALDPLTYSIDSDTQITVFTIATTDTLLSIGVNQVIKFQVLGDNGYTTPGSLTGDTPTPRYTFWPSVIGVSPSSGSTGGGTLVDITGLYFTNGTTSVSFGGNAAIPVTFVTGKHVQVHAPAGVAGVVDVEVTTPVGTSLVTSADHYTYVAIPTQTIAPVGIVPPDAFGTAVVAQPGPTQHLFPDTILSGEAFGTPTLPTITLDHPHFGIGSTEFFGTPTVALTTRVIFFLGMPSAAAFGRATVSLVLLDAGVIGIPSSEHFGRPTLRQNLVIAPVGIGPPST